MYNIYEEQDAQSARYRMMVSGANYTRWLHTRTLKSDSACLYAFGIDSCFRDNMMGVARFSGLLPKFIVDAAQCSNCTRIKDR